jgi:ABC-type transport system substrate-binding protein
LIYGAILGPESDLLPYWHSSQIDDPGLNLSGFSNALADKYLEEIRKTDNLIEHTKKIIALQNILTDEVPAIFLYSPTYTYPVSKKIKGIDLQYITMPRDRLANIENWFIKEKKTFKR